MRTSHPCPQIALGLLALSVVALLSLVATAPQLSAHAAPPAQPTSSPTVTATATPTPGSFLDDTRYVPEGERGTGLDRPGPMR